MTNLIIFISGILFATLLMPVLDSVRIFLQNIFDYQAIKLQKKADALDFEPEFEKEEQRVIGFTIDEEEE